MSGDKGGVQRLLKNLNPLIVFIHCRSHLLQLALVNACTKTPTVKRVISVLNRLYSLFSRSYVRLGILEELEKGIDGLSHKMVQPGQTRWLSYEGSVAVILRHYSAICLALEQIYIDSGDLSSEAGGLLLTLRKESTLVILNVLHFFLRPLARLSKVLQCVDNNLAAATDSVKTTIVTLDEDFDIFALRKLCTTSAVKIESAGVRLESEDAEATKETNRICLHFHKLIIENLQATNYSQREARSA